MLRRYSLSSATHDPDTYHRLRSVPGIGKVLALTILYEIHDIHRFPRVQDFLSKRMKTIDRMIKALSAQPERERDEYSLRNIYDLMSGYLEAYFEQRILYNVINRYRPNLRMNSLDKLRSIDVSKLSKLQQLYGQTSRKGSRHSQPQGSVPPTYAELCEHVEVLRVDFKF